MIDLIFLILLAIVPLLFGLSFGRFQSSWSAVKCSLVSAAFLPVLIAVPCIVWIGLTLATPPKDCGVDACGMAIAFALMGLTAAFVGFLVGFGLAFAGVKMARGRSGRTNSASTFK